MGTFLWEYFVENQLVLKNANNGKNEVKKGLPRDCCKSVCSY